MSIYTRGVRGTAPTREESRPIGTERPLDEFKQFSEQHIKEKKEAAALKESAEYERMQQEAANLEESRKQAEELVKDAEKRAKEQRDRASGMSDKVGQAGKPETTYMYDSHFSMVQEFAEYLSSPAVIQQYSSSPEGEIEFNGLVDQLIAMSNDFEAYYKETYGTPDDGDERYTFRGSENRLKHGVTSIDIDDSTLNIDTDHQEMMARLTRLDTTQHTGMKIENGRAVFLNESGEAFNPQETLDMEVFYPDTSERPPVSGAQYLESTFDPDYFTSAEDVERHIRTALSNDKRLLRDAIKGYIERMQDINPNFEGTINSIIEQNPERLESIKKRFIDDAVKAYEEKNATSTSTEPEVEVTGEEEIGEAQEQEQAMNQDPGLPIPEEIDVTITEEDAVEEMAQNLEREIGREITEEEKEMLFSPEVQAMLRAAGFSSVDMTRFTPEDPRSRGAQPTSGLEDVNISGQTEVTPRQAPVRESGDGGGVNLNYPNQRPTLLERTIDNLGTADEAAAGIRRPMSLEEMVQKVQNDRLRKVAEDSFDETGQLLGALDMGSAGGGATAEGQKKIAEIEAENEEIRRRNAEINAQNEEIRKKREEYENKFTDRQKPLFLDEDSLRVNEAGAVKSGLNVKTERGYVDDQGQPYGGSISRVSFDPMEMSWNIDLTVNGQLIKVPINMSEDGRIDVSTDTIPGVTNRAGRKVTYFEIIREAFNSNYGSEVDGQDTFASFLAYLAQRALE